MQPLSLADELTVDPGGESLTPECDHPEVPRGPKIWCGGRPERFGAATGGEPRVHIHLRKKIPVAAGLGGGSSDAAGTLHGLEQLAGKPLAVPGSPCTGRRTGGGRAFFFAAGTGGGAGHRHRTLLPWTCLLTGMYY